MKLFDSLFYTNIYEGNIVDLKETHRVDELTSYDGVPTIYYDICTHNSGNKVGTIELRLTVEGPMYYYGHVGYNILTWQRGHSYAYQACLVLFEIAKTEFNMDELIITCSPDNKPSYKTLCKLNGELVEEVDVPEDHLL